nr:hypothetical protein [Pandoravirus aubagnensis]
MKKKNEQTATGKRERAEPHKAARATNNGSCVSLLFSFVLVDACCVSNTGDEKARVGIVLTHKRREHIQSRGRLRTKHPKEQKKEFSLFNFFFFFVGAHGRSRRRMSTTTKTTATIKKKEMGLKDVSCSFFSPATNNLRDRSRKRQPSSPDRWSDNRSCWFFPPPPLLLCLCCWRKTKWLVRTLGAHLTRPPPGHVGNCFFPFSTTNKQVVCCLFFLFFFGRFVGKKRGETTSAICLCAAYGNFCLLCLPHIYGHEQEMTKARKIHDIFWPRILVR